MLKTKALIACALLSAAMATPAAAGTVYNFADFLNPVFSYGYGYTGYTFTNTTPSGPNGAAYGSTFSGGCRGQEALACTTPGVPNSYGFPLIGVNTSGAPISFEKLTLPTNTLLLHPDSGPNGGGDAILAFTAPTSGDYVFSGTFNRLDTVGGGNGVDVIFGRPGTVFSTKTIAVGDYGTGFSFNERYTLNQGQTIFLGVNNRGEYSYDSTGLVGTVAAVPEPGEWAMMLAGLGVVGWAARRRQSRGMFATA